LLAEIYIYNDHIVLAGEDSSLNAGTFHALITNWLGRGCYALAMESDPSKEKWNYPVYAYACSTGRHSPRRVEVKTNIAFAKDSQGEYQESPRIKEVKYFHYMLDLDPAGNIVGGNFLNDSSIIDMLWIPVRPKAAGQEGNERGNPYVDVDQVLALWRASVSEESRQKWLNIDPAAGDPGITLEKQVTLVEAEKASSADASDDERTAASEDERTAASESVTDQVQ
jgi:hypothetical protein